MLLESLWGWLCCCLEHGGDSEDGDVDGDGDALSGVWSFLIEFYLDTLVIAAGRRSEFD